MSEGAGGPPQLAVDPGLCARCVYAAVLRSRRSAFLRCGRADSDPAFARYPRLPVLACTGFEPRSGAGAAPTEEPPRGEPTG